MTTTKKTPPSREGFINWLDNECMITEGSAEYDSNMFTYDYLSPYFQAQAVEHDVLPGVDHGHELQAERARSEKAFKAVKQTLTRIRNETGESAYTVRLLAQGALRDLTAYEQGAKPTEGNE